MERYYVCPGVLDDASDEEFTREEWLAWYEGEFAGYDPEPVVEDDAGEREQREALLEAGWSKEDVDAMYPGPIEVSEWQLAQDRAVVAELGRVWRGAYRYDGDGGRAVAGAHPFSSEEGSAEWLGRVRSSMRREFATGENYVAVRRYHGRKGFRKQFAPWRYERRAMDDAKRSAIVAREASMRARHNARCWARAFAQYHGLDANDTCRMLDGWQKQNPIGWLGLEAAMKGLFESCHDHYFDAHRAWEETAPSHTASWNVALKRYDVRRVTKEEQDEWLDRMPVAPEYPTQLVTSVKSLRKYADVALEKVPADLEEHQSLPMPTRDIPERAPAFEFTPGQLRRFAQAQLRTREFLDTVHEYARAECVELYERREVPEEMTWWHGPMPSDLNCI